MRSRDLNYNLKVGRKLLNHVSHRKGNAQSAAEVF